MEKYKILKFLVMAVALIIVAGCGNDNEKVADTSWIELDRHLLALVIPGQATLTATVNDVTWSSSADSVATVDNGKVTAVSEGTAIITATSKADTIKKATCTVMVTSELVPVTGVTLTPATLELKINGKASLQPAISPNNATYKVLSWSSSNSAVVSVDNNGGLTAVALGTATITATAIDGSNKSATCAVTVTPILVNSVTLDNSTLTLKVLNKATLKATVSPSDATNKTLTWASSNAAVATVDQNGNVSALTKGVANITATSTDGSNITATCKLTVEDEWVTNGDFKTDDLTTSFFFTSNANPVIVTDPVKGRVLEIASPTLLTNEWDLQFWVLIDPPAKLNEQYTFTMDVRSDINCSFPTQAHYKPTQYIYWDMVGTISSTTAWSTYTKTVTIDANRVGDKGEVGAIAFNLGKIGTTVYITNISLKRIK